MNKVYSFIAFFASSISVSALFPFIQIHIPPTFTAGNINSTKIFKAATALDTAISYFSL